MVGKAVSVAALLGVFAFTGFVTFGVGHLTDPCRVWGLGDIDAESCRSTFAKIVKKGKSKETQMLVFIATMVPRVEASLFAGAFAAAAFALLRLRKGTVEVAGVHLMHAVAFGCACFVHVQDAGWWPGVFGPVDSLAISSFERCAI